MTTPTNRERISDLKNRMGLSRVLGTALTSDMVQAEGALLDASGAG